MVSHPGLRRAQRIAAYVALLAGCRARPAVSDAAVGAREATGSGDTSDAALDATARDAALDASVLDAASDAGAPAFSTERWLADHGVAAWTHDPSCWWRASGLSPAAAWINECRCERELVLSTPARIALLVCTRAQELHESRLNPLERTVLYAVKAGVLRVVLDVPTAAAIDNEAFGLYGATGVGVPKAPVGNVSLLVTSADASVKVLGDGVEAPGAVSCVDALDTAKREKLADVQRVYTKVCASVGVWRWVDDRLVREPGGRSR
jgi:hypothetical protein